MPRPPRDEPPGLSAVPSEAGDGPEGGEVLSYHEGLQARTANRQVEAMSLRLAGFSQAQIAQRLNIAVTHVKTLLEKTEKKSPTVAQMRELENERLDRAQAAIWSGVLAGDVKAVDAFLKISARRAKMNGMDEATKIDLSIGVRQEMEQALHELQTVVLGEVISSDDRRAI